jgi:hypothetical protein
MYWERQDTVHRSPARAARQGGGRLLGHVEVTMPAFHDQEQMPVPWTSRGFSSMHYYNIPCPSCRCHGRHDGCVRACFLAAEVAGCPALSRSPSSGSTPPPRKSRGKNTPTPLSHEIGLSVPPTPCAAPTSPWDPSPPPPSVDPCCMLLLPCPCMFRCTAPSISRFYR